MLTCGVLPLGLHSLLEQVEVCPHSQPAGCLYVIVQAATSKVRLSQMTSTVAKLPNQLLQRVSAEKCCMLYIHIECM